MKIEGDDVVFSSGRRVDDKLAAAFKAVGAQSATDWYVLTGGAPLP